MNAESATWRPEEQTLAVSRFRRTNCSLILNKTCKYICRKKNETYKINKRHYVCLFSAATIDESVDYFLY